MAIDYKTIVHAAVANGLDGLVGIGLYYLLVTHGIPVTPDQMIALTATMMAKTTTYLVSHKLMSNQVEEAQAKADTAVREVAAFLPVSESDNALGAYPVQVKSGL